MAIRRLYRVVLVHRNFGGDSRAVGRSIIVGRIIFSIAGGSGYVGGRSRECAWRLLGWLGLCLLHMLKRLV